MNYILQGQATNHASYLLWSMQVSRTCYVWILVYFQLGFHSVFWHFFWDIFFIFFHFLLKNLWFLKKFFGYLLSGQPVIVKNGVARFYLGKIFILPYLGKRAKNGPKKRIFLFLSKNCCLIFLKSIWVWKNIFLFVFWLNLYMWQNYFCWLTTQNIQLNYIILLSAISQEKTEWLCWFFKCRHLCKHFSKHFSTSGKW